MSRIPMCCAVNSDGSRCQNVGEFPFMSPNRGAGKRAFLCSYHANLRASLESYFAENKNVRGKHTAGNFTYSIEFECSHISAEAVGRFHQKEFVPTSDSTVFAELKSPVYKSMKSAVKFFRMSVDKLVASGDVRVGWDAGTHFHVGTPYTTQRTQRRLARDYRNLFKAVDSYVYNHKTEACRLFGRPTMHGTFFQPCDFNEPFEHENWINLQHSRTIEFRVMKYRHAAQYALAMEYLKKFMEIVVDGYYSVLYNADETGRTDGYGVMIYDVNETGRAVSWNDLQKVSDKLVRLTEKYFKRAMDELPDVGAGFDIPGKNGCRCPFGYDI